jgi:hypothetical protein
MVFVELLKVFELWNITSTVQRLPATVGEIDGELGVRDPARGAGVLALHAQGAVPFFMSRVSSTTSTDWSSARCSST